jgi:hypothetical protein
MFCVYLKNFLHSGLSGAGKTSIAFELEAFLFHVASQLMDSMGTISEQASTKFWASQMKIEKRISDMWQRLPNSLQIVVLSLSAVLFPNLLM